MRSCLKRPWVRRSRVRASRSLRKVRSTGGSLHGRGWRGHRVVQRLARSVRRLSLRSLAFPVPGGHPRPPLTGGLPMGTTRRSLLKSAGVAAAGSVLLQGPAGAAPAASGSTEVPSLRSLTYCMLRSAQGESLGVRRENRILDLGKAGKLLGVPVPGSTDDLLAGKALAGFNKVLGASLASTRTAYLTLEEARFGPCITRPQKIIMLGFNYRKHAQEVGAPIPKAPVLFNKYANALSGHEGKVKLPTQVAKKFDYEVELQVILGKTASNVSE